MLKHRIVGMAAIWALVVAGCGGGPPTAAVSGKITYKGQPVPTGTVSFVSESTVASGQISNGQYTVAQAPIGPVKITVSTPAIPDAMQQRQMKQSVEGKSATGAAGMTPVAVPPAFANPDSSGLTYTVTSASPQNHDIEIP